MITAIASCVSFEIDMAADVALKFPHIQYQNLLCGEKKFDEKFPLHQRRQDV